MATKRDGGVFLNDPLSRVMLLVLAGSIWYQGVSLHGEIRDLRTEMRAEIGDLRTDLHTEIGHLRTDLCIEIGGLREAIADLEVAVARIDARRSLRLMLTERFAATDEGASYGGPRIAAVLLLARALPEIDAALSTIDQDAQTELAEELWEDRVNILARASPIH